MGKNEMVHLLCVHGTKPGKKKNVSRSVKRRIKNKTGGKEPKVPPLHPVPLGEKRRKKKKKSDPEVEWWGKAHL